MPAPRMLTTLRPRVPARRGAPSLPLPASGRGPTDPLHVEIPRCLTQETPFPSGRRNRFQVHPSPRSLLLRVVWNYFKFQLLRRADLLLPDSPLRPPGRAGRLPSRRFKAAARGGAASRRPSALWAAGVCGSPCRPRRCWCVPGGPRL